MTEYWNSSELSTQARRQRLEAKRALWDGRLAFRAGVSPDDNPHGGWQTKARLGEITHQELLWCRWLHGWLIEYHESPTAGIPARSKGNSDATISSGTSGHGPPLAG